MGLINAFAYEVSYFTFHTFVFNDLAQLFVTLFLSLTTYFADVEAHPGGT